MNKKKELLKIMNELLRAEGWTSVLSFTRSSGVPYTVETTRRAFTDVPDKNLAPATLAIILKYLNRSPQEIRNILKTYADDKDLWPMIGEEEDKNTVSEQAILSACRAILTAKPDLQNQLANALETLSMAAGVDIAADLKRLQRKQKGA